MNNIIDYAIHHYTQPEAIARIHRARLEGDTMRITKECLEAFYAKLTPEEIMGFELATKGVISTGTTHKPKDY